MKKLILALLVFVSATSFTPRSEAVIGVITLPISLSAFLIGSGAGLVISGGMALVLGKAMSLDPSSLINFNASGVMSGIGAGMYLVGTIMLDESSQQITFAPIANNMDLAHFGLNEDEKAAYNDSLAETNLAMDIFDTSVKASGRTEFTRDECREMYVQAVALAGVPELAQVALLKMLLVR